MLLILKSLPLSVIVTLRMIVPMFLIFIASTVIWLVLGLLTLGYSSAISTPVTVTFIALYGMHVAFDQKGKRGFIDWRVMFTYSVAFGLVIELIKLVGLYVMQFAAIFAAISHLGLNFSIHNIQAVDESIQSAFAISAISFTALFALVFLAALQAIFAVPMAASANSARVTSTSTSFLTGLGTSFVPLFVVATISLFLQFFFKIFAAFAFLFGTIVFQIVVVIRLAGKMVSENGFAGLVELFALIDPTATLIFLASVLVVLWLQSWIWSIAVLAFLKHDAKPTKQAISDQIAPAVAQSDLRALRKKRENHMR